MSRTSILDLKAKKERGEKIVALTAYDYPTARILDESGVDLILIGDSAANVVLGYESTLPVTLSEMIVLSAAVARGARHALVVADLPFMSYQVNADQALESAGRFIKEAGVGAVKLEGGHRSVPAIKRIVDAGIPVMGHLGLTPQSHLAFGGHKVQGRDEGAARMLIEEARELEAAGVFSMVLEGIPWTLAREISDALEVPTVGIGAGADCDGQILVLHDMIGLGGGDFKFVKRFADVENEIGRAVKDYAREVREGAFPADEHRFEPGTRRRKADPK
jgi:3-methyl-2-oxobutanoate hydroxymethyltransferase